MLIVYKMWFLILVFIISIILYIITQYLRIKQSYDIEYIEQFNVEQTLLPVHKLLKYHNISIKFKNADVAKKLINKNSLYIQNMNQPNILARGCFSKDELYNKYLDAFSDISNEERDIISIFILDLLDNIKHRNINYYNYICYWINNIAIAKAKQWLEDGMPHTLENTIIMDESWFITPRDTTFIHELTHIHQRIIPFEFEDLYKNLGYIEYTKGIENIQGMNSVILLNRNNPDGLSHNWIWYDKTNNTYWWIGAVFANITPSSLTNVSNIALKLDIDSDKTFYYLKQQPTLLKSLTNFNNFFGNNPNNYHPNEMTAKFSEWYYTYDNNYTGFNIYKTYFDKLINTYYTTRQY